MKPETRNPTPLCRHCGIPVERAGAVCTDCLRRWEERQVREERQGHATERIREAVQYGDFAPDFVGSFNESIQALEASHPDAWAAFRNWQPGQGNLYVHGPCGTGKTYGLTCILREAAADNRSIALVPALRLADVAGRYDTPPSVVERWGRVGVLLLDDLGMPRWNGPRLEVLYRVLDARARTHRRTLVTANLAPADLRERMCQAGCGDIADATLDRLNPLNVLEMFGRSLRSSVNGDAMRTKGNDERCV